VLINNRLFLQTDRNPHQ